MFAPLPVLCVCVVCLVIFAVFCFIFLFGSFLSGKIERARFLSGVIRKVALATRFLVRMSRLKFIRTGETVWKDRFAMPDDTQTGVRVCGCADCFAGCLKECVSKRNETKRMDE